MYTRPGSRQTRDANCLVQNLELLQTESWKTQGREVPNTYLIHLSRTIWALVPPDGDHSYAVVFLQTHKESQKQEKYLIETQWNKREKGNTSFLPDNWLFGCKKKEKIILVRGWIKFSLLQNHGAVTAVVTRVQIPDMWSKQNYHGFVSLISSGESIYRINSQQEFHMADLWLLIHIKHGLFCHSLMICLFICWLSEFFCFKTDAQQSVLGFTGTYSARNDIGMVTHAGCGCNSGSWITRGNNTVPDFCQTTHFLLEWGKIESSTHTDGSRLIRIWFFNSRLIQSPVDITYKSLKF